jgi:hypothetical protein
MPASARVALVEHAQERLQHERVRDGIEHHEEHDQGVDPRDSGTSTSRALLANAATGGQRRAATRSHSRQRSGRRGAAFDLASWIGGSPTMGDEAARGRAPSRFRGVVDEKVGR